MSGSRLIFQAWVRRESIDDEPSYSQPCSDALLMLDVCQSHDSLSLTYFEFEQLFDEESAEAALFCEIES
ncbi:MAG: hypothetical protein AAF329_19495 [Cyanobacteria bacterium P01_A01_bin.17]